MAKPGRNDPCHCGSGKKYKKCCQPKEQAAEGEVIAKDQAARAEREAARRLEQKAAKAAALEHRSGQAGLIDGRHERGTRRLPKRHCRKALSPPTPPPLNGPAVDADELRQAAHARLCCALPQNPDDDERHGQIDLASEKAQRRWRLALAAAVPRAAQAEPQVVLRRQLAEPASRLARIVVRMHRAPAYQAALAPRLIGEVAIAGKQQIMEGGVRRQS